MKGSVMLALLAISLAACAKSPEVFRSQSSMELCMDYLTSPSFNINKSARASELSRRGEDCSRYVGAASTQMEADRAFQKSMQDLQKLGQPAPTPQLPRTCVTDMNGGRNTTTCY